MDNFYYQLYESWSNLLYRNIFIILVQTKLWVVKRFSKTLETAVVCGWKECPYGFKPFNDLNMFIILEYTLPTRTE